jgi:hypothetical protein
VWLPIPGFLPEMLMVRVAVGRSLPTIMPVFPRRDSPARALATATDMTAMEKAANRSGKRAAARRRAIRRKAAAWQRRVRRAIAMALIAASIAEAPTRLAHAQIGQLGGAGGAAGVGQGAMGSVGGLVNGAAARLADLEENGPGFMYYGINAADRGLGYRGSYYTVGGFIPYAEDDLGGVWNADLRTHLSNYGGFFSNIGAVRKQFWGGTLFGLGVYWDYDGDQNQYSDTSITDASGTYTFAGGQTYQQVGVSAEWLTDYGNLRSNGYIPCGTTAQQMGPFVGNSLLCQNGINAGLAGADLEVGAYIPGLADWAGMVSVGGYAFGNARYNNVNGTDLVPYFGGVYSRLDLTLIRNWDFSLQANNDSFFDWTGFARLTYRMGGSRRRNVPDQMEQPMMRNEHVVRAHQAPEQAINPMTGLPYEVFHVDNTTTTMPAGTGTWENPFTTLQQAQDAAVADYDIVFVHIGQSETCPYETPADGYQFQANHQYLVGEGTSLQLCTANCGLIDVWSNTASSLYPVITNPVGPAVVLTNGATTGATVDHVRITGSPVGISDGAGLPVDPDTGLPGNATINDVQIYGNGPSQRGVEIKDLAGNGGTFDFTKMDLQNLTNDGFVIDATAGGRPNVNISASTINNTSGSGVVVANLNNTGDLNDTGRVRIAGTTISKSTQAGVYVGNGNAYIGTSTFTKNALAGVYVQDNDPIVSGTVPGVSTVQVTNSRFADNPVGIWAIANSGTTNMTITNNLITTNSSPIGANGVILAVGSVTGSGTTGVINAAVVGNSITPTIATTSGTTTTSGSTSTTTTVASSVGNILLNTTGTVTGGGTGFTPNGTLNIKAADQSQLQSMNFNAGVAQLPLPITGTNGYYVVPPPPTYDGSLTVPLPNP